MSLEGNGLVKKSEVWSKRMASNLFPRTCVSRITGILSFREIYTFPGGLVHSGTVFSFWTSFGLWTLLASCSLATTCLRGSLPLLNKIIHRVTSQDVQNLIFWFFGWGRGTEERTLIIFDNDYFIILLPLKTFPSVLHTKVPGEQIIQNDCFTTLISLQKLN